MKNMLLHCCCGPCSIEPVSKLREQKFKPTAYFYNPNIHPWQEYKKRRDTLKSYAETINLPLIMDDRYELDLFLSLVAQDSENRCPKCYKLRLEATAKYAKENGFDCFSTTLFVSPYQDHDLIQQVGNQLGEKYDISFYYQDFTPYFRQGQNKARELGLYRQGYCGCIYSERDRYNPIAKNKA